MANTTVHLEEYLNPLSRLLLVIAIILSFLPSAYATEPLMDRIKTLEPIIGAHPPNIRSQEEFDAIKTQYTDLKSELDTLLVARPADQELLFMRGHLQSMGHNFDYPGAWQGATNDLKTVLDANPAHIPALLELAKLWVNSDPSLASNAEKLFRGAQCYQGSEPLEEAQQGLFFAFYYQGKMKEASRQSEYLKATWPLNAQYQQFYEITHATKTPSNASGNAQASASTKLTMTTCNE